MRLERSALYLALLVAWVATLGSLYFSEVRHLTPCLLCWYQRILMYPQALILPIGLLRRDEGLPFYTAGLSALGIGFSTYHYLLQKTDWFSGATSCQTSAPCDFVDFQLWGFATIPFMALVAFALLFFASLVVLTSGRAVWAEGERAPWLPVAAIVAAVALAFAPSFLAASPADAAATDIPITSAAGQDGATLYAAHCAGCHGAQGQGAVGAGPALVGTPFLATTPDADWIALVRAGRPADHPDNQSGLAMPAIPLAEADVQAILSYLRLLDP